MNKFDKDKIAGYAYALVIIYDEDVDNTFLSDLIIEAGCDDGTIDHFSKNIITLEWHTLDGYIKSRDFLESISFTS